VIDVNKHSLLSLHGVRPQATKKTPQDVTEVSESTDEIVLASLFFVIIISESFVHSIGRSLTYTGPTGYPRQIRLLVYTREHFYFVNISESNVFIRVTV